MARRRKGTDDPERFLPAASSTYVSPGMERDGDTYQDLVDDGSIGIDPDQVSSGETPIIYSILLMGG